MRKFTCQSDKTLSCLSLVSACLCLNMLVNSLYHATLMSHVIKHHKYCTLGSLSLKVLIKDLSPK